MLVPREGADGNLAGLGSLPGLRLLVARLLQRPKQGGAPPGAEVLQGIVGEAVGVYLHIPPRHLARPPKIVERLVGDYPDDRLVEGGEPRLTVEPDPPFDLPAPARGCEKRT